MTYHRYRPLLRPASFSTLPAGTSWSYTEMPPDLAHLRSDLPASRHRHGVIATEREFTPAELEHFSLARED